MAGQDDLGDIADGRRVLVGDFRAIGRAQLVIHHGADRNWWIGTFDGGRQGFAWELAGHTSFFGDLRDGHRFLTGRFSAAVRDDVLFHYPRDGNWWRGTFEDGHGRFVWHSAGNTAGFDRFWRGRFTGGNRDSVLLYSWADRRWRLGRWDATAQNLAWSEAGRRDAGDFTSGHRTWTGRFTGSNRDEMLLFDPADQRWWLGTWDATAGELNWSEVDRTTGFGDMRGGHRFWTGRFSRPDRSDVLFYFPVDQHWWLGKYDDGTRRLTWARVDISTDFGDLLAGHRFWSGRFTRDRDQVLFHYPGDGNWWLGTCDPAGADLAWTNASWTPKSRDVQSAYTGSFSRSDRTEVLVQTPDRHRWWLGSAADDWEGLWWRPVMNTRRTRARTASEVLRAKLREFYGDSLPGCVSYVTRDGRPFADGSFGSARLPGAPDGELAMTASSLVHVGSVTKLFGAVAILRLMQEDSAVHRDAEVFSLIEPFLDAGLIASYRQGGTYPGANVRGITIGQLLDHTSDLDRSWDAADIDIPAEEQFSEPDDDGPARFHLKKVVTALLKRDATPGNAAAWNWYNNSGYAVLTAVIEAMSGQSYVDYVKQRLFADPRFDDLAPKVADPVRAARYYPAGNRHPDYTNFSLAGGYYVSATALTEWIDALMQRETVGSGPILDDPDALLRGDVGLVSWTVERFRGFGKNGAAAPGGGHANSSVVFLRGYGDERICSFTMANAEVDADEIQKIGLAALGDLLSKRPGVVVPHTPNEMLRQTAFWDDAAALAFAAGSGAVDVGPVVVGGDSRRRTRLFGSADTAAGQPIGNALSAELRGSLRSGAVSGYYVFRLSSDDGAFLWIDDELIADTKGDHGMRLAESEPIWLGRNAWYPIRVRWYNAAAGGAGLCLEWKPPGSSIFVAVPDVHFTDALL